MQKVHTHSQQYQQAVKVRCDTPAQRVGSRACPPPSLPALGWAMGVSSGTAGGRANLHRPLENKMVPGIEYQKGFLLFKAVTGGIHHNGKDMKKTIMWD